ncbi:MAG TPA: AI-2E family transporter [Gemmataceae bacterium]|jgi:AI-2 transport protein TqsA
MTDTDQDRSDRQVQTTCLVILTIIAVGVALHLLKPVLVPFFLALFFTYCLAPLIDLQVKHLGLPRLVAVGGAITVGLAILLLCGFLLGASVGKMGDNFEEYQTRFDSFVETAAQTLHLERVGIQPDPETGRFLKFPANAGREVISSLFTDLRDLVSSGAMVVIFMIFILLGRKGDRPHSTGLLGEIEQRVQRYTVQLVIMSVVTGVLVGGTLALLNVEYAFLFGFLAFLLNFIPSIGSIIATLLPIPVVLLSPDLSVTAMVLALTLPAVIQFLLGNVVQPKIQGSMLELHPVAVLMALIFFGMIWGISGAFLAAPITAVIKIILERIPATRPMADLLAGNLDALNRPDKVTGKDERLTAS